MVKEWAKPIQKFCFIPQRYILGFMCFLAVINAYTMRNCLSVTITEMVKSKNSAITKDKVHEWTEVEQGLILGSFYWGYVLTHIPGGIIADKKGGKYTLSLGILSTAIFTLITPVVVDYGDWPWLVVLRILEGLGEGTTFPALSVLLAHWIPIKDRSKYSCIVLAGTQLGTVVANCSSGYLIQATGSWSSVFYVFGAAGVLWYIFFEIMCWSRPEMHPYIRDKELEYLVREMGTFAKPDAPVPWFGIWTSMPVIALIIAQVGHDWIFYAMVSDLPKYMKAALDLSVSSNGLYSSMPYMFMWVCSLSSGFLADWMLEKKYMTVGGLRKLFTALGAIFPATFIIAASYAGRDIVLVIALFTIAMGTMGPYYAGMRVNALDITTNYAGIIMGLENGIGALSGFVTPWIIGIIVSMDGDVIELWRIVFWITFGISVSTSILYIVYGSGELQYWNDPDTYKEHMDNRKARRAEKKAARKAAKEERRQAQAANQA